MYKPDEGWPFAHVRVFSKCGVISVCRVSIPSFEVDGTAYRRSDTPLGNKDDEIVANSCRRKIDKKKQAVDLKVTGEVSPSGRMAHVGTHVIGRGFPGENSFCY